MRPSTPAPSEKDITVVVNDAAVKPGALVAELSPENYNEFLNEAVSTVVVDFYIDTCGPCKLVAPEVAKLAAEYPNVKFGKFDCAKWPKGFAYRLGVSALPTFYVYQKAEMVGKMVGGKPKELRKLVENYSSVGGTTRDS